MIRKIRFLAVVAFIALFVLIVNAAEEQANESLLNETSNSSSINDSITENDIPNLTTDSSSINENKRKAVTASFGVYLNIVG